MLYRLYVDFFKRGNSEIYRALENEDFDYVIKLIKNECYNSNFKQSIARNRHIYESPCWNTMLTLLLEHDFPKDVMLDSAAMYGKLSIIHFMCENGATVSNATLTEACREGHIEVAKYLVQLGCDPKQVDLANIAGNRQFETLKWLHSLGAPLVENIPENAAYYSQWEMVKWSIEQGCVWGHKVLECVSECANLEMMQWLYEKNPSMLHANLSRMLYYLFSRSNLPWRRQKQPEDRLDCFTFLFTIALDKQAFWYVNVVFPNSLLSCIDLSKEVWQPLFDLDLSHHKKLKERVDAEK